MIIISFLLLSLSLLPCRFNFPTYYFFLPLIIPFSLYPFLPSFLRSFLLNFIDYLSAFEPLASTNFTALPHIHSLFSLNSLSLLHHFFFPFSILRLLSHLNFHLQFLSFLFLTVSFQTLPISSPFLGLSRFLLFLSFLS